MAKNTFPIKNNSTNMINLESSNLNKLTGELNIDLYWVDIDSWWVVIPDNNTENNSTQIKLHWLIMLCIEYSFPAKTTATKNTQKKALE